MSGRSPRPDFGRTDYRFKINDNFGMLHETTLYGVNYLVDDINAMIYTGKVRVDLITRYPK